MDEKNLAELTDQELLEKAKKLKSKSIINAFLVGFMIGIIIYSIVNNGFGFFLLIPLFIIHKLVNNSKEDKALKEILAERNLK